MPIVTVKITGRQQLLAAIQDANKRLEAATESVLDGTAGNVEGDAKANCPVSSDTEEHKNGSRTHMRDTIAVKKSRLRRIIGTDKDYWKYVEFGTYKMKARPFLFPAGEKNRQGFIRNIQAIKV